MASVKCFSGNWGIVSLIWYLSLGNSGLEFKSQIQEVVGVIGSGLVSLHLKGTLTGELLTTSGN